MIGLQFISPDCRNQKLCLQSNLACIAIAIGIATITGLNGTDCAATNHGGSSRTTSDWVPPPSNRDLDRDAVTDRHGPDALHENRTSARDGAAIKAHGTQRR